MRVAVCVILLELVGGRALILGLGTRIVAAQLAVTMVVALSTVHLAKAPLSTPAAPNSCLPLRPRPSSLP